MSALVSMLDGQLDRAEALLRRRRKLEALAAVRLLEVLRPKIDGLLRASASLGTPPFREAKKLRDRWLAMTGQGLRGFFLGVTKDRVTLVIGALVNNVEKVGRLLEKPSKQHLLTADTALQSSALLIQDLRHKPPRKLTDAESRLLSILIDRMDKLKKEIWSIQAKKNGLQLKLG